MINHVEAYLDSISVHHIPHFEESSGPRYSESAFQFDNPEMRETLLRLFFNSFKEPEYFKFNNIEDNSNVVYDLVSAIFDNPESTHAVSLELAKHLFQQSKHPQIKSGDLMVAYVQDVLIDDEMLPAVVIIKSENKETFLKIDNQNGRRELRLDSGIPTGKLDKACIIFDTGREQGYKCCVLDKTKTGEEAVFWTKYFLDLKHQFNDYQKTKVYIQATKGFIDERLKPMYDVEKQDEAQILDLSKTYFNNNDAFDEGSYLDELFGDQEEIKSEFRTYRDDFEEERGVPVFDDFNVSQAAVKKQSKVFRSVIKLDKNFHIYVHGNRNMIEKGEDEMGRKFYKLYFDSES